VVVVPEHGEDSSSQIKIASSSFLMGKGSSPSSYTRIKLTSSYDFIFYDVDGNILYQHSQWSLRKSYLPSSYIAEA